MTKGTKYDKSLKRPGRKTVVILDRKASYGMPRLISFTVLEGS